MGDSEPSVDELRDLRAEVAQLESVIEDKDATLKDLEDKADMLIATLDSVRYDLTDLSRAAADARK
jgi:aryl carrier-like protein